MVVQRLYDVRGRWLDLSGCCVVYIMRMLGFKAWHALVIWLEGEWHLFKGHWNEIVGWMMFGACLSALTLVLGFAAGYL